MSLPGAEMASVFWILPLVTGEWRVVASSERVGKAKLSKPSAKTGEMQTVVD